MTKFPTVNPAAQLNPDWSVSGGQLLQATLAVQGLRQSDLAERTGLSPKHINQIIKRGTAISGDTASALELALGVSADAWTRADAIHEANQGRRRARERMSEWLPWASRFDRAALEKHRVLNHGDHGVDVVSKVLDLFRVSSPQAFDRTYVQPRVSFRRTQDFVISNENTALWLRLIERASERRAPLPKFSPKKLRAALPKLRALTTLDIVDGLHEARLLLADAGVDLVFVSNISGTRIKGATWWVTDRPIIGVTEHYRRADIVWFSIFHEIGHILLHPRRAVFIDEPDQDSDGAEGEADTFAAHEMLGADGPEYLKAPHSRTELQLFATRAGVDVSIVVGQYLFHHRDAYRAFSKYLRRLSDGDVARLEEDAVH